MLLLFWKKTDQSKQSPNMQTFDKSGTDVMIFKIFSLKNSAKKFTFLTQNKTKLCKNLIITLVFEKNANFSAENWQKSQKIVIITSVPGHPASQQQTEQTIFPGFQRKHFSDSLQYYKLVTSM
jgi:hypothetical protein